LIRYSHGMHRAGWVANHDGNLSARIGSDRYVITPTSMSKLDVEIDDLVVVDGNGKKVAGRRRPFSEMILHLAVYNARPKVGAVVHAHPPYATAFGAAGKNLPHPFLPEAVVSLGAHIPTIPLTAPGAASRAALEPYVRRCDAVLIAGNGVLTWGPSLELAYLRMELVEHLARISNAAANIGGTVELPREMVDALVAKRTKAGLAAPEEGGDDGGIPRTERLEDQAVSQVVSALPQADAHRVRQLTKEIADALTT